MAVTTASSGTALGVLSGSTAMVFVGGSVAISKVLANAPLFTAQAIRYAIACLLLVGFTRLLKRKIVWPRGSEWLWLLGVTLAGLVIFNVALVRGAQHAEPAVLGVAVSCVPVILAIVGPLLDKQRPNAAVLLAAVVVTGGAALVQGAGHCDGIGLIWAVVVMSCEAAFTLLAVPVLGRLGPWGVSVHTTWLAAVIFAVLGITSEGPAAVTRLNLQDAAAIAYLAVAVTAIAFVCWYSGVRRLGAGRAGLITGVAPIAAGATGVAMGGAIPHPLVWVGIAVVAAGLVIGLTSSRTAEAEDQPSNAAACRPAAALARK